MTDRNAFERPGRKSSKRCLACGFWRSVLPDETGLLEEQFDTAEEAKAAAEKWHSEQYGNNELEFQEMMKLKPGQQCPRCGQIYFDKFRMEERVPAQ